ncbi:MAG: glycosyltransferase [Sulfitobacter sp.]
MVTILMGVWNGAQHLQMQLDSIVAQHHTNWHLFCSDDGSSDDSMDILQRFARQYPSQITIRKGPKKGFAANYMAMISAMEHDVGFVCFADQDDVWLPDKIGRALACLGEYENHPALYCGRRIIWTPERGRETWSPTIGRQCSLRNALVENIASGNTIMLNPKAAALAIKAAKQTSSVFAHDWWLYLLLTGCGGTIHFDPGKPQILYRQHRNNAIGNRQGLSAQFHRKKAVICGLFSDRVGRNLDALRLVQDMLTPAARHVIRDFAKARKTKGVHRLVALIRVAPYRQTWLGTIGFWGAASLGRV